MRRWSPWQSQMTFVALASLAVAVPILVVLILAVGGETWFPGGDMAQAELHMRGFFSHPPLVGAAGRIVSDTGIQGSHPGPGLWVAMLPVYLLGGRSSAGLMAAVVSVHLVSVTATLWLAARRGGRPLVGIMAIALLIIVRSSGPDFVIEPWNPWLAVLPFAVFVFLLAEMIQPTSPAWQRNNHRVFAACVLVGSYCIQCHAGYVVIVSGGLLFALGYQLVAAAPQERWGLAGRNLVSGGIIGSVMWVGPIVDQLRRDPGNLEILWQHFASPNEPTISLRHAAREIATQVNVLGPWLTGPSSSAPAEGWARYVGCFALVIFSVGCWRVARRRQWVDLQAVLTVCGVLLLVGALAISRIFGPYFEYTIRWMWVIVAITVASCAVVIARLVALRLRPGHLTDRRRQVGWVGVVISCSGLILVSAGQLAERFTLPGPTDSRITAALHEQLVGKLDPDTRYLLRFYDPYTLNATGFGVTLALERSGFDVGVDPFFAAAALPHRIRFEESSDVVLWVVVGPAVGRASDDSALRQEAFFDPRTIVEQIRGDGLLDVIATGLRRAGRGELLPSLDAPGASLLFAEPPLPSDIAELVRQLVLLGQPVGIYSMAPSTAPVSLQ